MLFSTRKKSVINFATIAFLFLALPVLVAIGATLWLTASAARENIRFVRASEQALTIIADAQDIASKDENFGQIANEDIVASLQRRGHLTGNFIRNPWGGVVRAVATPLPELRFETELPSRACRRLALYFAKNGADLKLQKMETQESGKGWLHFYDAANSRMDQSIVNQACGKGERVTLAVTLHMRS